MSLVEQATRELREVEVEINTARYNLEQTEKSGDSRAVKQAHKQLRKLEQQRMKLFKKVNRARSRGN
ncbi:MAG TPA: hypothetical protein VFG56_00755 [Candidatus Saccharimonadales bacterium]|nr:hypothetical protein [Candidatus Saccharimonadales bacterium]